MPRSVLFPLAFGLSVLTAVALLGFGYAATDGPTESDLSHVNADVVRWFYDAVNAALETGDAADLEGLLTPDFVDRTDRVGLPPTGGGLVHYLFGLRAAFPAARLIAEDVVAQGDRVAARVRLEGMDQGAFLGLALAGDLAPWGALDFFRVDGGRIAEYWGGRDAPIALEPLFQAPLVGAIPQAPGVRTPPVVAISVRRLTLAPGAVTAWSFDADALVYIEVGGFAAKADAPVHLRRSDHPGIQARDEPAAHVRQVALEHRDLVSVPAGTTVDLHNPGESPAAALVTMVATSLFPSAAPVVHPKGAGTPLPADLGVSIEVLADVSGRVEGLSGSREVAAGIVALAPGAPIRAGAGPRLALLVVEHGSLAVTVDGIEAQHRAGAVAPLLPGQAASLRSAGAESLALLIVTVGAVAPGDASATAR